MFKLSDILEVCSLPGLQNIFQHKYITIRVFYLLCYLVLLAFCGQNLAHIITDYFNFDVITNVKVIREKTTQFPAVTFCLSKNSNKSLQEIIIKCQIEFLPCNWTDFEVYSNQYPEICYRFNSGKNYFNKPTPIKNTSRYDSFTGFLLILDLEKNFLLQTGDNSFLTPYKTVVFIQNQSTIFRRDHSYNIESGIPIPAGISYLSIRKEISQQMPPPYNDCGKQDTTDYVSNLHQYFIRNNKTYLQKDCFDLCIEEIIMQNCNCSSQLGKLLDCFINEKVGKCIFNLYYAYILKNLTLPSDCIRKCPLECDRYTYTINQNYLGLISNEYWDSMNLTTFQQNNNIVVINTYFSSLDYLFISEIAKTSPFDLVSNIGGSLGLFIGFSFLNIAEIFEIFLTSILSIF